MPAESTGGRGLPPEAAAFLDYWFGALHERLAQDVPDAWLATPRGSLAAVMVLDQLPRNFFRDDPRAYATDKKALALAKAAVDRGADAHLSDTERMFLYVPFQHSENAADQARSVALYEKLGGEQGIDFARKHRDVIDRFGRFPHRNKVLGRESTPEEVEFLKGPALFW